MSKTNDIDMAALDPAAEAQGGGTTKSKAIRVESKTDGETPVFRLDSLAPGASQEGATQLPTPAGSRVSQAAIFFAALIIGGGGLLFAMRKIGINPMSAIANMKEPDVDLTKTGKPAIDHTRVLRDLSESTVKGQVPLDQVQKNPFEIPEVVSSEVPDGKPVGPTEQEKRDRARQLQIQNALASLEVHGILGGSRPVARINDEAVRIGDKVLELFTVKAIQSRSVELEVDGQTYTISLDDQSGPASSRKSAPKKK